MKKTNYISLFSILLILSAPVGNAYALEGSVPSDEEKQKEIERQIESLKEQNQGAKTNKENLQIELNQAETEILGLKNNIQTLQDNIDQIESDILLLDAQVFHLEKNIIKVAGEIDIITQELQEQEGILGETVSFLYEFSDTSLLEFFFKSGNLEELLNTQEFIRIMMDENDKIYKQIVFNKESLSKKKEELTISKLALKSKKEESERLKAENLMQKENLNSFLNEKEQEQLILYNKIKAEEIIEKQASNEIIQYIQKLDYLNRLKEEENNQITFSPVGESFVSSSYLSTPLPGYRISSDYGPRFHPVLQYSRFHNGVDLGGNHGEPMFSAGDGVVVFAGPAKGFGNWVVIYHGVFNEKNIYTIYGHMESNQIHVSSQETVKQGQLIAQVGNAGTSTGPHLHFGVAEGFNGYEFNYVDPKKYIEFK